MINETGLREEVLSCLYKLGKDDKLSRKFIVKMGKEYGIAPGRTSSLMGDMVGNDPMSQRELLLFAKELIPGFDNRANNHFTPKEQERLLKISDPKPKAVFPIEFLNTLQINDEQYLTLISTQTIIQYDEWQILSYNLATQRNPKIVRTEDGKEHQRININRRSVKEIKNLILEGHFIPNAMTWNVRQEEGEDAWDYNEETNTFVLKMNGFDIIDGYHRHMAIQQALKEKKNLNILFPLYIVVFDEDKAKSYIAQEDKRNKIDSNYSKALDVNRFENRVIRMLNEDPACYFYNQFFTHGDGKINYGRAVTTLCSLFKTQYNRKSFGEARNLKRYIMTNINDLLDTKTEFQKDFSDFDFKVALCCFDVFYGNKDLIDKTIYYIDYYRKNKTNLLNTSAATIRGDLKKQGGGSHE